MAGMFAGRYKTYPYQWLEAACGLQQHWYPDANKTKVMRRSSLILSLMMAASWVSAQETTYRWNPAANAESDGSWTDAANWDSGFVPDAMTRAVLNVVDAIDCVVDSEASAGRITAGDNGPGGRLIVEDGGVLTVGDQDWSSLGYNNSSELVVEAGGTATFGHHLWIGFTGGSDGKLTLNGGSVSVAGMTGLGWDGGKGTAVINGGTLNLAQFHPENSIRGQSVMDVGAGTVIIAGDHVGPINSYVNSGKIVAFGGSGTLTVDFDVTNPGATTITAEQGDPAPAQTTWDPSGNPASTGLWAEDANWSGGRRPGNVTRVDFKVAGAPQATITSAATADRIIMGDGGPGGNLVVSSGSGLSVAGSDWSAIGYNNSGTFVVEDGAVANFGGDLLVGDSVGANGVFTMNGGSVSVAGLFSVGANGGVGTVQILGGMLNLADPSGADWIGNGSVLDIVGTGIVSISGDQTAALEAYIANGRLTANGGSEVYHSYDIGANETTIAAEYIGPIETFWASITFLGDDGRWATDLYWTAGLPGKDSKVVFNISDTTDCTVDGEAFAGRIVSGDGAFGGNLIVADGGMLTVGDVDWSGIGWTVPSELTVEDGGSVSFGHHLWIGFNEGSEGTLTMNGGTVTVSQMIGLGWGGGKGVANIKGGTLNLSQFHPENSIKGDSVMDVSGSGSVVIVGDHYDAVKNYVDAGRIKSNGSSDVIYYYDPEANRTVISTVVPPQRMENVSVADGMVTVTFQTIAGQTYRVDRSPQVPVQGWSPVPGSNVTAEGGSTSVTFPAGGDDAGFFRSVLEPGL